MKGCAGPIPVVTTLLDEVWDAKPLQLPHLQGELCSECILPSI